MFSPRFRAVCAARNRGDVQRRMRALGALVCLNRRVAAVRLWAVRGIHSVNLDASIWLRGLVHTFCQRPTYSPSVQAQREHI